MSCQLMSGADLSAMSKQLNTAEHSCIWKQIWIVLWDYFKGGGGLGEITKLLCSLKYIFHAKFNVRFNGSENGTCRASTQEAD